MIEGDTGIDDNILFEQVVVRYLWKLCKQLHALRKKYCQSDYF